MSEATPVKPTQPKWKTWTGWILSLLPVAPMAMSAFFKIKPPPEILEEFGKMGFTADLMRIIGVVEIACVVIYLIPQTAVLGAILLTGYLGGATEVHAQKQEWQFIAPVAFGVIFWLGLFLRDPRQRVLIPFRKWP